MSYHIYNTDGIVLKRVNFGESNALFYILTADLGLIISSAQAVRSHLSKLNSALQEYSLVTLSCVKGKNGWKLVNAVAKENFFFDLAHTAQRVVSQIALSLLRMIPGEQKHPEIFSIVAGGFSALKKFSENPGNIGREHQALTDSFEILMMLRILHHLGYLEKNRQTEKFLQIGNIGIDWDEKILSEILIVKSELVKLINQGLQESQL
jgi:recombinational DNA repair protein (RecF pathway)